MDFETRVTELNKNFFFNEFTYSNNKFMPTPKTEVELADNIIWVDNILIVFQLKERNTNNTNKEKESKWFSKKILTEASRQIKDTISYLEENSTINIENHRGHKFDIELSKINEIHKIICYFPNENLPAIDRSKKYKISQSVGFIHIFPYCDYQGIVNTLITPAELFEYLGFREQVLTRDCSPISIEIGEQSLVGQFLSGELKALPSNEFHRYLLNLDHRINEWDVSGIIKKYIDRMITNNHYSEYYKIISEISKLKRKELKEFKKRFELSMQRCGSNKSTVPCRMASPRTGCGFVFIPLDNKVVEDRQTWLKSLTHLCKYDLKLNKCIGISFYPDNDKWYFIEWCFMEFTWEHDEKTDKLLMESNIFRPIYSENLNRYNFLYS